jgi:acetyltransferase-like isoleucine patch superfamily enzyme
VIEIGKKFETRNWWWSNPLGINHPTIICTWKRSAQIIIGNNVGVSGGSIVASKKIEIGDGTLIGVNTTIIDTDFHPIKSKNRRYDKKNIKSKPVKIGKNVFIGMNCVILKGVEISDNSVIPAGSVLR